MKAQRETIPLIERTITAQPRTDSAESEFGTFANQIPVRVMSKTERYCFNPKNACGYLSGVAGGCFVGIVSALAVPAAVNYFAGGTLSVAAYIGIATAAGIPGIGCVSATAAYFSIKKAVEVVRAS